MSEGRFSRELRILLIGRTGHGKSSTGNSILGAVVFKVSAESQACTRDTETGESERFGNRIRVTDTPGFFDTDMYSRMSSQAHLRRMLLKCVGTLMPGLDAICFVIKKGERFTPELQETQRLFFDWFGNEIENYAYMIVTHCGSQEDADRYLQSPHRALRCLLDGCQGRVFPIENHHTGRLLNRQIKSLIDTIVERKAYLGSHQEVKSKIIEHIAETKSPKDITYESLDITELFVPVTERLFKSKGFTIIEDRLNVSDSGVCDEEQDEDGETYEPIKIIGNPGEHNEVRGNITIIDNSACQTGLYFNPLSTADQFRSSSLYVQENDVETQTDLANKKKSSAHRSSEVIYRRTSPGHDSDNNSREYRQNDFANNENRSAHRQSEVIYRRTSPGHDSDNNSRDYRQNDFANNENRSAYRQSEVIYRRTSPGHDSDNNYREYRQNYFANNENRSAHRQSEVIYRRTSPLHDGENKSREYRLDIPEPYTQDFSDSDTDQPSGASGGPSSAEIVYTDSGSRAGDEKATEAVTPNEQNMYIGDDEYERRIRIIRRNVDENPGFLKNIFQIIKRLFQR